MYIFAYHIVSYPGNCEALHEITDLVREMLTLLSVCAPLHYINNYTRTT